MDLRRPTERKPLTDRERSVLEAVVRTYVETAEPAGSRALTRRYNFGVSPATIRNTMADLEDDGYLTQTAWRAGRRRSRRLLCHRTRLGSAGVLTGRGQ